MSAAGSRGAGSWTDVVAVLNNAAAEIARDGHLGWGNACTMGAETITELQSVVAALVAGRDAMVRVPEGWKLVPMEPTGKQCLSGKHTIKGAADHEFEGIIAAAVYKNMVADAPSPPTTGDDHG